MDTMLTVHGSQEFPACSANSWGMDSGMKEETNNQQLDSKILRHKATTEHETHLREKGRKRTKTVLTLRGPKQVVYGQSWPLPKLGAVDSRRWKGKPPATAAPEATEAGDKALTPLPALLQCALFLSRTLKRLLKTEKRSRVRLHFITPCLKNCYTVAVFRELGWKPTSLP